jgi:hypothetical protein
MYLKNRYSKYFRNIRHKILIINYLQIKINKNLYLTRLKNIYEILIMQINDLTKKYRIP